MTDIIFFRSCKLGGKTIVKYIDPANSVTALGMALSLSGAFCVMGGWLRAGMTLLILSGVCDLFDGYIARKTKRTDEGKMFGLQFDTVADIVSFGVAPAIMACCVAAAAGGGGIIGGASASGAASGGASSALYYFWNDAGGGAIVGVSSTAGAGLFTFAVCIFYVICAAVRLAHFNVSAAVNEKSGAETGSDAQDDTVIGSTAVKYYDGLPVTYIALILPLAMLPRWAPAGVIALIAAGALFVANIKIPKPRGIWYALFPLIAAVVIALWWLT